MHASNTYLLHIHEKQSLGFTLWRITCGCVHGSRILWLVYFVTLLDYWLTTHDAFVSVVKVLIYKRFENESLRPPRWSWLVIKSFYYSLKNWTLTIYYFPSPICILNWNHLNGADANDKHNFYQIGTITFNSQMGWILC